MLAYKMFIEIHKSDRPSEVKDTAYNRKLLSIIDRAVEQVNNMGNDIEYLFDCLE